MPDATVSAGLARGFLEFAVAKGADPVTLAERAGIDPAQLEDHDNRVPFANYVALVRTGKELCNDPALPLHFAEAVDMAEFSIVGLLANAAETMLDAFVQLNRYGQLVIEVDAEGSGARFAYEHRDTGAWLIDNRTNPNDFPELTESTFTRMITGPRRFLPR